MGVCRASGGGAGEGSASASGGLGWCGGWIVGTFAGGAHALVTNDVAEDV